MLMEEADVAGIAVDTLSLDFGPSPDFATHYAMRCQSGRGARRRRNPHGGRAQTPWRHRWPGTHLHAVLITTVPLISDDAASPEMLTVFDDIQMKRNTDYVNNFWHVLANDPAQLQAVWERLQRVMGPGALDPLVKELIYIAVSVSNGCSYCVHSHTAAARAKGITPEQHDELMAVIAMASQTDALATALQVETDARFTAASD